MMRFLRSINSKFIGIYVLLCLAFVLMSYSGTVQAAVFEVNSTDDSNDGTCDVTHCSLREAINAANALTDIDTITFNIPGGGVQTIQPTTPLPIVSNPVIIDGTTQPGYAVGAPVIELNGINAGISTNGLVLAGGGSTIRGLVINRFKSNGIVLKTTGGNTIEGNFIGTDAAGAVDLGNTLNGVQIEGTPNNTIGGTTPSSRNLISGNENGIVIFNATATGNYVQGNYIGTNAAGSAAVGNTNYGVVVAFDAGTNTIGGTAVGAGNLISGNNPSSGMLLGAGVGVAGNGNLVQGNKIGTDVTGTQALGNGFAGIWIENATNSVIGGVGGSPNIIAFNNGDGVYFRFTNGTPTGNQITTNSIFSNTDLGIDLGNTNGITINDPGDSDTGANNLQNYPILMSITPYAGRTPISGTLNSTANTTFRLEFFFNETCTEPNYREGKTYLGYTYVTSNGSGNAVFNTTLDVTVTPQQFVTATATDPNNNTSEFSECAVVSNAPAPPLLQPGPIYTVNTTADADDGYCGVAQCSLREAIYEANGNSDTSTITFAISSGGLQTIQPTTPLPIITSPVIIDGTTQPGFAGTPLIELDGTNAGTTARGLTIVGGNSTIKGLIVNRFLGGIWLADSGGNVVTGNYIGTDSTGTQARGNNVGISTSQSLNNRIGGTTPAERNIISGNTHSGIGLYDGPTTGTVIEGNYIGTDVTGQVALGNGESGIEFQRISDATIGGITPAARNIISGNQVGIFFVDTGSEVLIEGNYIGTNATGTAAIPNQVGIWTLNGTNLSIGAAIPAARNIISGNVIGIKLGGVNNRVQGNYIGVAPDGVTPLGNSGAGIEVDTFYIGTAPSNTIGGLVAGTGNLIAHNGSFGITSNASNVLSVKPFAVLGNSIFSNGNLGIDLGGDGITSNDIGDADTGPNGLQNFPVLSSGGPFGTGTTVNGTLNSQPNKTYRLEFFANAACDPSGYGEGQNYLGFTNVSTNGNGDVSFSANLSALTSNGQFITATATDPDNNTSEFSACVPVVIISPPAIAPGLYYFTTSSVRLSWQGVSWAIGYEIEVDNNNDFSSPEYVNRSLVASAQSDITSPLPDGVYYWRVGAKKIGGGIVWSAVQSFTVDVP